MQHPMGWWWKDAILLTKRAMNKAEAITAKRQS